MESIKTPKTKFDSQRSISSRQLLLKMSEAVSLREKVAQAELSAGLLDPLAAGNRRGNTTEIRLELRRQRAH